MYRVATATELNAAIVCHNQSTATFTAVLMLNDIAADTVADDSVFERVTRSRLFIQGNPDPEPTGPLPQGFRLSRASSAGTEPLPLLAGTSEADIGTGILHLELGPSDTFGIQSGIASMSLGAITSNDPHPEAVGISVTQSSLLSRSIIRDVSVGVETVGSGDANDNGFFVIASTIVSTSIDARYAGEGFSLIDESTFGGPIGITFGRGSVEVRSSTVLGDAALPEPTADENGLVSFASSIANTCSATEIFTVGGGPGWTDSGGNAGACFSGGEEVVTAPLADNGCSVQFAITPIGCAPTAAIDASTSAYRAASNCNADQRGVERGEICDSGAYETRAGDVTYDVAVDNADVQALLDWLAGGPTPMPPATDRLQPTVLQVSDLTSDGAVRLDDALRLAQLLAG